MPLLPYEDALQLLLTAPCIPQTEEVSLLDGLGRIAADPIKAPRAQPPVALSAMDGYAVKYEDACLAGATLRVIGEIPAGGRYNATLNDGEAIRIFTVIQAGDILLPIKIALAAAANKNTISVVRKPRITLMSSGDELAEPGGALSPDKIINSAAYGIGSLITSWGGQPHLAQILPDKLNAAISDITPHLSSSDVIAPRHITGSKHTWSASSNRQISVRNRRKWAARKLSSRPRKNRKWDPVGDA